MTGKAIITLSDAQSGRVISRTEEKNMVTNAVKNLFSPSQMLMFNTWYMSELLKGCLPLYKNILGGIVLLGEQMEEDEDNIILPSTANVVGYAGNAYSGTNVMRGSLNINESYETENGYHFAWDFPTDKANGKIRCLALTNRLFGNIGFNTTETKDGSLIFSPYAPANVPITSHVYVEPLAKGYIIGSLKKNTILRVIMNSNVVTFRTYTHLNPQALKINDDPTNLPYSDVVIELPRRIDYYGRFFVNTDDHHVYFFALESTNPATIVHYYAVDYENPVTYTEGSVSVPSFYVSAMNTALYKNKLYIMTSTSTKVFDMDGNLVKEFTQSYDSNSRFFTMDGSLYSVIRINSEYYYYNFSDEGEHLVYSALTMRNCPAPTLKPPYGLFQYISASATMAPICMCFTNYMATINNLASPIVKTSSQTLKIEYIIEN